MPRSLIVVAVLGLAAGFIIYQLAQFFLSINNGRNRLEKELHKLKSKLRDNNVELIPFDQEDFKNLSGYRSDDLKIPGGYDTGLLTSIFSEEIAKYGKVRLLGSDYSVLVVQIKDHEIIYNDYVNHTQVLFDGRLLGVIDNEGVLRNKANTTIARLQLDNLSDHKPIIIDGKEVGQVIKFDKVESINTRAFQLLKEMDKEEEKIFLVLSLFLLLAD